MVRVEWVDSATTGRWQGLADVKDDMPLDICTIGHLVRNDEVAVIVAGSYDSQERPNVGELVTIPRCAVRKVEYLRVSKRGKK